MAVSKVNSPKCYPCLKHRKKVVRARGIEEEDLFWRDLGPRLEPSVLSGYVWGMNGGTHRCPIPFPKQEGLLPPTQAGKEQSQIPENCLGIQHCTEKSGFGGLTNPELQSARAVSSGREG